MKSFDFLFSEYIESSYTTEKMSYVYFHIIIIENYVIKMV